MTPAIQILEAMGQRPLGAAGPALDPVLLAGSGLPRRQRQALLDRDMPSLVDALDGRGTLFCMLTTPEQAPVREPDEREDDDAPAREDAPSADTTR